MPFFAFPYATPETLDIADRVYDLCRPPRALGSPIHLVPQGKGHQQPKEMLHLTSSLSCLAFDVILSEDTMVVTSLTASTEGRRHYILQHPQVLLFSHYGSTSLSVYLNPL